MNRVRNNPTNANLFSQRDYLQESGINSDSLAIINERIDQLTQEDLDNTPPYVIPDAHREA